MPPTARPMLRAIVLAATLTIATGAPTLIDTVATSAQQYIEARRLNACPQEQALGPLTGMHEIRQGSMYELTFDAANVFHVVYKKGHIAKVVPDICDQSPLKRPAVTMAQVDEINSMGLSWKAGISPEIFGRAIEEFGMGHVPPPTSRQTQLTQPRRIATDIPVAYDARDAYPGQIQCKAFTVMDQGGCGSCYAFAASASFSARMCRAANSSIGDIVVSQQQLMDCGGNACNGGNGQGAYTALINDGATEVWCNPYTQAAGTCNGGCSTGARYFAAQNTIRSVGGAGILGNQQIQYELLLNGPGTLSLVAVTDIYAYAGGVYTPTSTAIAGGHEMSLIGWGVDNNVPYWLLQNSWGTGWGEGGFIRFIRGIDASTIESRSGFTVVTPLVPTLCPNTQCALGATVLADCSCRCDNGGSGPDCSICPPAGCLPAAPNAAVQAQMTARLDAAQPLLSVLRATPQAGITVSGATQQVVWLKGNYTVCFHIPFYIDSNPKQLQLYIPGTGSYYPLLTPLPAAPQACVNLTVPGIPKGSYNLTVAASDTIASVPLTLAAANAQFTSISQTTTTVTVTIAWTIDAAYASTNDIVQIVDSRNTVVYWFYTACNCQTQTTGAASTSGNQRYTISRSYTPKGGFQAIIRPGGNPVGPTGSTLSWIPWKAYGMA